MLSFADPNVNFRLDYFKFDMDMSAVPQKKQELLKIMITFTVFGNIKN